MQVFLFDATFTLLRRMLARERFWRSHCTHCYQMLIALGWSHRGVQLFYLALSSAIGAFGLVADDLPWRSAAALVIGINILLFVCALAIRRRWKLREAAGPAAGLLPRLGTEL